MDFTKAEVLAGAALLVAFSGRLIIYVRSLLLRDQKHLVDCLENREKDRSEIKELHGRVERLDERVSSMKDSQIAINDLSKAVESLSKSVLEEVSKGDSNNN